LKKEKRLTLLTFVHKQKKLWTNVTIWSGNRLYWETNLLKVTFVHSNKKKLGRKFVMKKISIPKIIRMKFGTKLCDIFLFLKPFISSEQNLYSMTIQRWNNNSCFNFWIEFVFRPLFCDKIYLSSQSRDNLSSPWKHVIRPNIFHRKLIINLERFYLFKYNL